MQMVYYIPGNTLYLGECPYPAHQCRHPQLSDFYAGLIVVDGNPISVTLEDDTAVLWNDQSRAVVKIPCEVTIAAQSFAAAFGGQVITDLVGGIL